MWKKYFKVVKIVPGDVIVPGYGKIDLSSDDLSIEMCQNLIESDFPYLAITEEGKDFLYGKPDSSLHIAVKSKGRLRYS